MKQGLLQAFQQLRLLQQKRNTCIEPLKLHRAQRIRRCALLGTAIALSSCSVIESDPSSVPLSVSVSEDSAFNQLFQRCGPGWTGGDSTYSTSLSSTQVLWLFSDTFIGTVNSEGRRSADTLQFVQGNTLVLQDKNTTTLTTLLRKTAGDTSEIRSMPTFAASPYDATNCPGADVVPPADAQAMFQPVQCPSAQHCYFWGGATTSGGERFYAFLQLMEQTGSGVFDFSWRGSVIATLPLDKIQSAEPAYTAVPNNGVSYGGAVVSSPDQYTYIYGMRDESGNDQRCSGHCVHVARAPAGKLAQPQAWQYWGATAGQAQQYNWTGNAEHSLPMMGADGVASAPRTQDQLGVTRLTHCGAMPECYVMIAHQYTGGASENILAWYAAQPQGPWAGPVFVYQTPESRQPGQLFTYNAKIHPVFANEEGLLVSYDVNSLAPVTDPLSALVTAASYRPRFIRVKLHWGK